MGHRILLILVVCALLGLLALTLGVSGKSTGGVSSPSAPSAPQALSTPEPSANPSTSVRESVASEGERRINAVAPPATRTEPPASRPRGEPFVISGRVIDDQGQPLTRCRVTAEQTTTGSRSPARGMPLKGTYTNVEGCFLLHVSGPGQWAVTARARGRRSAPGVATVPDPEAELVLVVARSASIHGSVVDERGVVLGAAHVHLLHSAEDYPEPGDRLSAGSGTRADAFGRFELRDVLPGRVRIFARHEGHAESEMISLTVRPNELIDDVVIAMSRGGRIEGRLDSALEEIGDRDIHLYSMVGTIGWRSTKTDAQGRFYIENITQREYIVELKPSVAIGHGTPIVSGEHKRIFVADGATTHVEFGPARRASILVHGRVLSHGTPVSGLSVVVQTPVGTALSKRVETDSEGFFTLSVEKPGDHQFVLMKGQGSFTRFDRTLPNEPEVEVLLEVPGGGLSGRVLGSTGEVVGRLGITLVRSGGEGDPSSYYRAHFRKTFAAADGSFEFHLLEPGTYTLRTPDGHQLNRPFRQSSHGRAVIPDIVIGHAPVAGFEVRLQPGGRVSGVLVDSQGHAVTDAWIHALDFRGIALTGHREVQTDATGHFVVAEMAPGIHTLVARTGEREIHSAPVVVEAGRTVEVRMVMP